MGTGQYPSISSRESDAEAEQTFSIVNKDTRRHFGVEVLGTEKSMMHTSISTAG